MPNSTRTKAKPTRRRRRKLPEIEPNKRPTQARARATFDAIVTACARLLATEGYADVTTNHIARAAGVGIGSVYEYFPGKDAIVAEVAARLVDRILADLTRAMPTILAEPPATRTRAFMDIIYEILVRERRLVAVFVEEVPYTRALPSMRSVNERLFALSHAMQVGAGITLVHEAATLHLMINLTTTTILQLVLDPPSDVPADEMLSALAHRIATWVVEDASASRAVSAS